MCCGNSGKKNMAPPTDAALEIAWRALGKMADDRVKEGWRTIPIEPPSRVSHSRRSPVSEW